MAKKLSKFNRSIDPLLSSAIIEKGVLFPKLRD
jgi:hypothetical protein